VDRQVYGPSDRCRLLKAKADIEDLKAQELDGRLISINDVSHAVSSMTITIRNRLLAIPSRAAALLAGENDPVVTGSGRPKQVLMHWSNTGLGNLKGAINGTNVRHDRLLLKVAQRVDDYDVMRLLKLMLKANGRCGVPQGGVISPLLSNLYLNEVDCMLQRAKEATRNCKYTYVAYARFADDLYSIMID
jgi:hypothetical protein